VGSLPGGVEGAGLLEIDIVAAMPDC